MQQRLSAEAAAQLAAENAAALESQLLDADRSLNAADLTAQVIFRVQGLIAGCLR